MHLVSDAEAGSRAAVWSEKYAAYKPQKHLPVIPQATRLAMRDSSALLTSAMLIGDDGPDNPPGEVTIAIASFPTIDFHGVPIQLA